MQLSTIANTTVQTMSSREIAELTGKELSHIHRDIRTMIDSLKGDPVLDDLTEEKDTRGYTSCFNLNKELTLTLVAGYNVKLRLAIIKRWQELEAKQVTSVAMLSRMDILKLALEAEEARIKAEEERDHAVKTKMQISDKKTATAMATASAAVRETNKLKEQLGFCSKQATVIAVENATRQKFNWTKLKAWCKQNNTQPVSVPDARFGEAKAWPAGAWLDCYGIDLVKLFKR